MQWRKPSAGGEGLGDCMRGWIGEEYNDWHQVPRKLRTSLRKYPSLLPTPALTLPLPGDGIPFPQPVTPPFWTHTFLVSWNSDSIFGSWFLVPLSSLSFSPLLSTLTAWLDLLTLPDASGYSLPYSYIKPSLQPYLGAVMSSCFP